MLGAVVHDCDVWLGDGGTDKKARSGAGAGRGEHAKIVLGSHQEGQD